MRYMLWDLQISMPKFVCGNYGIWTYTRGPHSLD